MDKRNAVRIVVRVPARCRAQGVVVEGFVEEVSNNGVFMRSELHIQPGSPAEIVLELPDENLHLGVQVVRVEQGDRAGMALRVSGQRSRMPLANFIMQQHQEAVAG